MKTTFRPGTMLYPLPAVLVSCGSDIEHSNLITVAWVGTICSDPAMVYISVRPERHSYPLIRDNMCFTINLTTPEMAKAVDWCGVRSGRDYNKWHETGLTPVAGMRVCCPYVDQAPVALECRVRQIMSLGSHDMFMAEVLNVIADDRYIDPDTGALRLTDLLVYSHGAYYPMSAHSLGHFGFSVRKKKK